MADEKKIPQQKVRKLGRAGKGKKENFFIVLGDEFIKNPDMEKIMITDPEKKAKGGRAGLKGGGICIRGMNKKAVGKNS